jgi:hypothetical protein
MPSRCTSASAAATPMTGNASAAKTGNGMRVSVVR